MKELLLSNIRVLLVTLAILISQISNGQDYINKFNHISTSDQFSLNSVTSISQDSRGLIWFGTRKGLVRYDGLELKFIKRNTNHKSLPKYHDVNDIHIDKNGSIWMATNDGLCLYDPKKDSFHGFPAEGSPDTATSSKIITCVREMNSGEIWLGTNNGLNIYNPNTRSFKHLKYSAKNIKSISSDFINCLYQKKDGTIWVGTNNGLNKLVHQKSGTHQFKVYRHDYDDSNSLINDGVNTLLEDKEGNLWVGTQNGLDYLNPEANRFTHFSKNKPSLITHDMIRAMTIDREGRLWVGTYDGITLIDSFRVVNQIRHDPDLPMSLVDNKIRALFTDKNGSVWVGSYYGGINYWNERQLNFTKIDEGNGHKLSFKVVSAIAEDAAGKIYFGTEGEGLSILDPQLNKYSYINNLAQDIKIGAVKTILLSGANNIWIGTFNNGLIYYNKDNKTSKNFKYSSKNPKSISSNKVISIAQNTEKELWVGTLDSGLNLLRPLEGSFLRIKSDIKNPYSIQSNSVRELVFDKKGNLYVGTTNGLYILQKESIQGNQFKFIRIYTSDRTEKVEVLDIVEDRSGRIWVGTTHGGLYQIKNNVLLPTIINKGIPVYSILQDSKGMLWLSSSEGIIKYNPDKKVSKIYNFNDGVPPNEFARSSKLLSKNDRIYFGGASGVTTFRPDDLGSVNRFAPNVVITDFKLFDKSLEAGDSTGVLMQSIEETPLISLDYDQNIFTINFSMPNFVKTGKNTYEYRLRGLDDKWITTSTPSVSYTIQQGGTYVFEVRGKNSDGFQTSEITSLEIEVSNPPWKTWWAYLIYSFIVLVAFLVFVYFFQSRLVLQHKLDMETREFQHQQEVNKQKLQFFTNVSHEFRTPLTLISGPMQKLIEEYKGPHKFFTQLLAIKKNTDQLTKLINELLDFRKFEDRQMKLQAGEGNIVEFLREIFLSFSQQANLSKFDYTFETDAEQIMVYFDPDKLEKVFYNLLANAFKHTPKNGSITLHIKSQNGHLEVLVKDNGDGMDANEMEKIFDRFYEIPGQKSYGQFKHGSGIGLAIVKSVIDLHKGQIWVESEEGKGSCFVVSLPLGRDHLLDEEIIKEFKDSDVAHYGTEQPLDIEPVLTASMEETETDKKCILVVEDNVEVGEFIKSVLAEHYRVVLVENGVLGCQSAISAQPSLIISDMMMPEMDGMEFCSKIKGDIRTSHIPFILLSARTSLVYKYDGLGCGADDYLYKPFEVKELLLKCKNIINTHDRLKEKFLNSSMFVPSELPLNSLDETMMHKAYQIVKENISNEFFGVEQFSEQIGMSRSMLFVKIKAWTNQTPNEFILSMRIKQAASMIEQNRYNIAEIGYKVGFKDPSYFSKIFKKHLHVTPKIYAEKFSAGFEIEEDESISPPHS